MSGTKSNESRPPKESTDALESTTSSTPQANADNRPSSRISSASTASQADVPADSNQTALPVVPESVRKWTADTFDWNVGYMKSVRGILNILTLIFSMLAFSILAAACQIESFDYYVGFNCRSSDTFLFVISCNAFIISALKVVCCLFSINSDESLKGSSYEVTYYFTFCALFLTSSLILLASVSIRNKGKFEYEYRYGHVVAGSVLGLMCCVTYGLNSIWFLICHKLNRNSSYSA